MAKPTKTAAQLADLREEYQRGELHRDDLPADPGEMLRAWLETAQREGLLEPNAMSLATVDAEGQPHVRTVLLKGMDARGLVFYTNYESAKAHQITANPKVSVCFPWIALERQAVVDGIAEKVPTTESLKYFLSRPLGSRLGAWSSPQSQVITSRSLLEAKLAEVKRKFSSGEVPLPDFWGGYRIVPTRFEFWQGRRNRLHDRFQYTRSGDTWEIARLAP